MAAHPARTLRRSWTTCPRCIAVQRLMAVAVDAGHTDHSASVCSQCCHSTIRAKLSEMMAARVDLSGGNTTEYPVVDCLTLQKEVLWCRPV
jgi:hypothetical protein